MKIDELLAIRQLWITNFTLLDILSRLILLRYGLACQSFATVEVTEYNGGLRNSKASGLISDQLFSFTSSALFSVNLTELLLQNLKLTDTDLNTSIFFADAEQSRPFVIQPRPINRDKNKSISFDRWYELISTVPLDREQLCNINLQPERVALAYACCSKTFNLPTDVVMAAVNQPCCIFLGITIASRGTYVLRMQINDVNDNAPRFNQLVHASNDLPYFTNVLGKNVIGISENTPVGSWFPVPAAVDHDEGPNGAVRYIMQALNGNTLWTDYFKLINNIREAGLPTNSTSASFIINNLKNVKHFDSNDYNGPGLLILQSLDREKVASFAFKLIATDLGSTFQLSSFVDIRILILDENDNAPIFERSNYQVRLRENQASVSLLSVKVHDADSDSNGRLSYTMQPSRLDLTTTKGFSVSADFLRTHIQLIPVNDGVTLRVIQPLDYEKQTEFTFDLVASDHGQPALSATAHVHVTVINVNDFAPLIRFYYHGEPLDRDYSRLSVLEQHESVSEVENKLICHVHVTDADSEFESINCTVESTERSFFLREVSTNRLIQRSKIYELLTTTRLDREAHERLLILVRCRDGETANSLVSQNQLQLILLDVNDHSPMFTQEHYHGSVSENSANAVISFTSPAGKTPTHGVQATDMDIGMNALIFYSLVPWVINDTDDNHTAWEGEAEKVIINATHTDTQPDRTQFGRTTNTSKQMHSHNLREDVDKFYIDQATGQIRTRIALDCEGQQVYRFLVLAIDQSEQIESRHTATARVTIRVSDENDNPPVIKQRHYAFSVKEGLPRHTRIGQIQSVDADINSENQRTIYELKNVENCNASEFILVESHTGYLRTRQVLDCEATKQISFIVLARNEQPVRELFRGKQTINTDKGPTFFDEVSVTVTVEDENDNAPALVQRGLSINDRVIGGGELTPSVIDLTFKTDQNETNNPCIEFPYVIVDRDEGANGQTEVLLENNAFFEFRLDNTILCKKRIEQPTVNQMNLFITVQDKPVDKTKTLKRQYTIRIHFVKDKVPIDGSRQLEQFQVSRFSSNPAVFSGIEQTETKPGLTKHSKSGRKSKIRDSGTKLNRVDKNEFHSEKPLNSSATIIIVAILVVVSGLLCLLLLGVVFALRKATPTRNNTSSDFPAKPCEEEAGDNSGLPGQRAQMQHIYFASRYSPASYQTSNSAERFPPATQTYMWTKGSLDRGITKSSHTVDVNQMYAPELHLLNNQLKSLSPSVTAPGREIPFRTEYMQDTSGQQSDSNYERCKDHRDLINYTKPNYSPLQMKMMVGALPVSSLPQGKQKAEVESYEPLIGSAMQCAQSEGSNVLTLTKTSGFPKSPEDSNDASTDINEGSKIQTIDPVQGNSIGVEQLDAHVLLRAAKRSECTPEVVTPRSMLKKELNPNLHALLNISEQTRSPNHLRAQTSFV